MPKNNNHRSIRISAKSRNKFIERLLQHFKINYKHNQSHRNYIIGGINLDKAYKIGIASLHPEKHYKFNKMIFSIKEKHYPTNYLKKAIYSKLDKTNTSKELAKFFKRELTRVQEVLSELKREDKIENIKIKDKSLWAKNDVMERFLLNKKVNLLKNFSKSNSIIKLSKSINLGEKAIRRRLRALEGDSLVKKEDNTWKMTEKGRTLLCGIDEAGKRA